MFSRNVKPEILGLGMVPKEIFLAYSTQLVFLTIMLVPGNVVMVGIDMCEKSPTTGKWIYGITWKRVYFDISVLFIVDNTSILKLVFPIYYCFCLDIKLIGCVVIIVAVAFFMWLQLIFVIITTVTFDMRVMFYCRCCR